MRVPGRSRDRSKGNEDSTPAEGGEFAIRRGCAVWADGGHPPETRLTTCYSGLESIRQTDERNDVGAQPAVVYAHGGIADEN